MPKRAVLLLAHGTPETVEQIPEYLRNVVSGRPLPQSVVEEIQHRYSLIGKSPLTTGPGSMSGCVTGSRIFPTWCVRCGQTGWKRLR
jgi:hypothetical protein